MTKNQKNAQDTKQDTKRGTKNAGPDLDEMAKRYLDLWQRQMTLLSEDAGVAELMAKTLELTNTGAARAGWPDARLMAPLTDPKANPFLAAFSAMTSPSTRTGTADDAGTATRKAPHGAKTAAASGRDPDDDVAKLARRVRALEKRIAELEAGTDGGSKRPKRRPKKR